MKKLLFLLSVVFVLDNVYAQISDTKLINLVNPFIGTDFHGHTYPGAVAPFGMVQLSPDTRLDGWDGCSGYHYSDTAMYGFSHTHLSGTGCLDYGDILFIPTTKKEVSREYKLHFFHKNEQAHAGYYKVKVVSDLSSKPLSNSEIWVELTATPRAGYHLYTYPKSINQKTLIIDLKHRDSLLECDYKILDSKTVVGFRRSKSWNENQFVYFAAKFSQDIKSNYYDNKTNRLYLYFNNDKSNNKLEAKVSLSSVNTDGALRNLNAEYTASFSSAKRYSEELWEKELSKIKIEGGSLAQLQTFYTALYHTMVSPNLYSDVDGQYRGMDEEIVNNQKVGKIYHANGYDRYTVFSLWDTYRTFHPLMTIIDQKRTKDWINTFIDITRQNGILPVWELSSFETYCMIGMHAISMITDALMKGIRPDNLSNDELLQIYVRNVDADTRKKMYQQMNKTPKLFGLDAFDEQGYIPSESEHESVSKTLEYAYNMWCVAMTAKYAGNETLYKEYIQKAQYYKNLFNPKNKFIQPRENGRFIPSFDPTQINQNYTEANGWQYTFYVPQDIETLIDLMGQDSEFCRKLDECFNSTKRPSGKHQADVTGLIGQYAHGNEPSQHMAYLYAYAGQPYKTQKLVRYIMQTLYTNKPDGICGNEDAGQMSAWYIMSAMGFYPVCPGSNQYVIGSPLFNKVTITLENGKTFVITAKNQSSQNIYVRNIELKSNANNYKNKMYISHADIMNGGELIFEMSSLPNKLLGYLKKNRPSSIISDNMITVDPIVDYGKTSTFSDNKTITLSSVQKDAKIYYSTSTDSILSSHDFKIYTNPINITKTSLIASFSENQNIKSQVIRSSFVKIPTGRAVTLLTHYDQYTVNGGEALIDQIGGGLNWHLGNWQAYLAKDVIAIVDLGSKQAINKIGGNFIQDVNSCIFMPIRINYYTSDDGKNFALLETVKNNISERDEKVFTHTFFTQKPIHARYIKMEAISGKITPSWHVYRGEKSWLFIDEIVIK